MNCKYIIRILIKIFKDLTEDDELWYKSTNMQIKLFQIKKNLYKMSKFFRQIPLYFVTWLISLVQ